MVGTVLVGCAGWLPGQKERPAETYVLAPQLPAANLRGRGPTLLVSHPDAAAGYATFRMAYLERDFRLDYFGYSEWVDTPPAMLRPLLVEALRASGSFRAVTDDGRMVDPNLRLDTVLLAMHQDFRRRPSMGTVALRVQIVDLDRRRILDTRTFRGTAPAPSENPYGGVLAINRILAELLPDIARFAASQAAKRK